MRAKLFVLILSTPAFAQPVTSPARCEVTVSRAPDDVRAAIEKWVSAEPRCATTLEVRAIPTDGGIYLFARDGGGRVRERLVPDAQSAGVLVASWAADDGIAPPSTTPPPMTSPGSAPRPGSPSRPGSASAPTPRPGSAPTPRPGSPSAAPTPMPSDPSMGDPMRDPMAAPTPMPGGAPMLGDPMGPGMTAPLPMGAGMGAATSVDGVAASRKREAGRWLTLGAMTQMGGEGAYGARAELDIARRGRWIFGGSLAGTSAHFTVDDGASYGYLETIDIRALASLARVTTWGGGKWQLRLSLGAGVMSTNASGELGIVHLDAHGVFPTAEASALFARELRGGWAIAAGPLVTWYSQSFKLDYNDGAMSTLTRRDLELMAFGGIRRRL